MWKRHPKLIFACTPTRERSPLLKGFVTHGVTIGATASLVREALRVAGTGARQGHSAFAPEQAHCNSSRGSSMSQSSTWGCHNGMHTGSKPASVKATDSFVSISPVNRHLARRSGGAVFGSGARPTGRLRRRCRIGRGRCRSGLRHGRVVPSRLLRSRRAGAKQVRERARRAVGGGSRSSRGRCLAGARGCSRRLGGRRRTGRRAGRAGLLGLRGRLGVRGRPGVVRAPVAPVASAAPTRLLLLRRRPLLRVALARRLLAGRGGFDGGGACDEETSAIDIAPTILRHLDLPSGGMDGKPLPRD